MSDTTSTNFSVAQANSTDSVQTGSVLQSNLTKSNITKKLCFYKSGDPRFNGIKMVVTNRSFKTFDALLDSLSKKVPLPFGVRNITTPRGIHHVTTLEELEDGKSYICSQQKKVKPINLERASKKPLRWQSSRPLSARRRAVQEVKLSEPDPFHRENTVVIGSSKKLVIFKNGDTEFKHNIFFNKKSVQSFDVFLEEITEALQYPVFKLYSTDGRRILSIRALLLSSGTCVAAGREPFKPANYENETEFLPAKLPGITNRVIPKARSKPEMKSQLKTNEPILTSPSGQKNSVSSNKICNTDNNFVDCSYIPQNEISLTEHWPHPGEELPGICPGDNIEKSIHLNSDGTMTVEMRVRFKLKEEETINWSTTVSRSELSYYKTKLSNSNIEPEVQIVSIRENSLKVNSKDQVSPKVGIVENKHESCAKVSQLEKHESGLNINLYRKAKKENTPFYRPPTPGIRKGQERRASLKIISEGNMRENIRKMFFNNDIEQEDVQSETSDSQSNELSIKQNGLDNKNAECFSSKHRQENFEVLETSCMELLQSTSEGKKVLKKSDFTTETNNYIHYNTVFQKDRPHTAGKQMFHHDQFKFKEIKRSVSASVTYSEPSKKENETYQGISDSVARGSLLLSSNGTYVQDTPCLEISGKVPDSSMYSSVNLECKTRDSLENEMDTSHYNQSRDSEKQKKKKKKMVRGEINLSMHEEGEAYMQLEGANIQNAACYLGIEPQASKANVNNNQSPEVTHINICDRQNQESGDILNDDTCISHVTLSSENTEINTIRKLKGNKQMAKVKPRSVRKIAEPSTLQNDNNENRKSEKMDNDNLDSVDANYVGIKDKSGPILYSTKQEWYPLTEHIPWHGEKAFKKVTKKSHKSAKKPKVPKKKAKTKIPLTNKGNGTEVLGAKEVASSPVLCNSFESYVQSWLKNIFPNTTFPVIQLFPSPMKEDITSPKKSHHSEKETNTTDADVYINVHSKETNCGTGPNNMEPSSIEQYVARDIIVQHGQSLDEEAVSILMEKGKNLAELIIQHFADSENNASWEGNKSDELVNWIIRNQIINLPQKKASLDVAVQVERVDKDQPVHKSENCAEEVLVKQLQSPHMNIYKTKIHPLERSSSLPGLSSKGNSSSSQVLLAWLLVLHLKQGMKYLVEDVSKSSSIGFEIFTLLQSLKRIAITEKADDLKAAVINLQESALRLSVNMESLSGTREEATTQKTSIFQQIEQSSIREKVNNHDSAVRVKCTMDETMQSANSNELLIHDNDHLIDDLDDLLFFASVPSTEISGEHSKHSTAADKINVSKTELREFTNITNNKAQGNTGQLAFKESITDNKNSCGISMNLSKCHDVPSKSDVNYESATTDKIMMASSKKVSKVKMMVQEMEQRKCCNYSSEYRKCTHSSLSSDWSDYRQDSEESLNSETLQASSEIMTESGEEQIQEKPIKTGYVRRAIERLYGKAESKISPVFVSTKNATQKKIKESTKIRMKESAISDPAGKSLSKENILRTLSSPSNYRTTRNQEESTGCLKSTSLPLLELEYSQNNALETEILNNNGFKETQTKGGVLIDKGRWLLKENHLVRRSPPETIGMYSYLDTTSADTFLDTTSDEVLYPHAVGKMNQQLPLGDVSSSEIEDMVKPHHCHYFNMPHGSDSEPFNDASSVNARGRPKSSDTLFNIKSQDLPNTTALKKSRDISGSLPSFATVDLHFSDNKVHPLPQLGVEESSEGQASNSNTRSRAQVKEQDSLDKLHFICGQHCPILAAMIVPTNEASRGFAYQSPNDVENLLFFPSESSIKVTTPFLANELLRDKNNNIRIYYDNIKTVKSNICNSNTNKPFHFTHVCITQGTSQYLLKMCSMSMLNILIDNSRKKDNTTHTNSIFLDNSCTPTDENNNVLCHIKLL